MPQTNVHSPDWMDAPDFSSGQEGKRNYRYRPAQ